jgi:hypothetical protein
MNGTIAISRVTDADEGEYMRIEIRRDGSMIPVVILSMTMENIALALTGRAFVPVEIAPEREAK